MEVEAEGEKNRLSIKITYPNIDNITYNFKLIITVSKQQIGGSNIEVVQKILYIPQPNICIYPISGGQIYKIVCLCHTNSQEFTKTVFTFVSKADE